MATKMRAKDLKRDAFAEKVGEAYEPALRLWQRHGRTILIVAGAALLLILLWASVSTWLGARNEAAQADLGAALRDLEEAELGARDETPDWLALHDRFLAVADEHGGVVGRIARHHAGVALLRSGDTEGAIALLEPIADEDDPWRTPLTLAVLASAYEEAGRLEEAEGALERLRDEAGLGVPRDAATMELALFLERHGRTDEAAALYRELSGETVKVPSVAATDLDPPSDDREPVDVNEGIGEVEPPDVVDENEAELEEVEQPSPYAAAARERLRELES